MRELNVNQLLWVDVAMPIPAAAATPTSKDHVINK